MIRNRIEGTRQYRRHIEGFQCHQKDSEKKEGLDIGKDAHSNQTSYAMKILGSGFGRQGI